ncbi:hypothetical protein L798_08149 [Zootermopsis nevadensis]|uniref:Uncharacterized protein n=1 Tax=Zootermopsis nevadensis TaxID=136037 RepID=A0A067R3R0_ZOONE|nr:hypothetical protein L798_08149 [Zootermopsis nevadensis]
MSGHRKCSSMTRAHRATKQLKLRSYCFEAVHQLELLLIHGRAVPSECGPPLLRNAETELPSVS